ncbi:unnamed protein product [Closterium sp. NIES-54]
MAASLRVHQTRSCRDDPPNARHGESRFGREGAVRKEAGRLSFPAIRTRHRVPLPFLLTLSLPLVILLATTSFAQDATAGQSASNHAGNCAESNAAGSQTCAASADASAEGSESYFNSKTSENEAESFPDEFADDGGSRKLGSVEHDVAGSERAMVEDMLTWMGLDWTRDSEGPEYGIVVDGTIEVSAKKTLLFVQLHSLSRDAASFRQCLAIRHLPRGASQADTCHLPVHSRVARWTSPLAACTKPCLKLEALRTIPRVAQACGNRMTLGRDFKIIPTWLLRERAKGAGSPWARFLRSLPAYVPLPGLFPQGLIDGFEYWPIVDQATRLKAAYADLYDRCSGNPAAVANATRSEFYWALTIVTSRCFTFSPSMRARGGGEEQQAEGAEGGGDGGTDGADGAEVAAEAAGAVAAEAAGGEAEEGSSGSSSSSSGGGSDGGGSREEDWYATSAAMLPFADLFNHDYYPNMGWKVRDWSSSPPSISTYQLSRPLSLISLLSLPLRQLSGDHFLFTTYQAIEKGEPLRHRPSPSSPSPPAPSPAARPITPLFPPRQLSGDHFLFTTYQAIEKGEPLSISYGAKPTIDMVAEYGFVPSYNPFDTVILFSSSARLVEYTVQQTHPTQPQPTQSHPANATLRGALRVAASVRGVVERMREERQTGVQQGQGRAQQGEGQEAQGGEVQRGKGQGEGEEAEVREEKGGMGEDGTNADGSMGGEWWEGMENEEELENAMKQLVVWAGGHASPEMLAMAAAVWHWIDTGRGEKDMEGEVGDSGGVLCGEAW